MGHREGTVLAAVFALLCAVLICWLLGWVEDVALGEEGPQPAHRGGGGGQRLGAGAGGLSGDGEVEDRDGHVGDASAPRSPPEESRQVPEEGDADEQAEEEDESDGVDHRLDPLVEDRLAVLHGDNGGALGTAVEPEQQQGQGGGQGDEQ